MKSHLHSALPALPALEHPRGTVKFCARDGVLSRHKHDVKTSMDRNGNQHDPDRGATVEIKGVGETEAKAPAGGLARVS
jgi:hypothetical protein